MTASVAGIHLGIDTHANRPAANTAPDGSMYSCSTHGLIYKSNYAGNSWATWATLGGSGLTDPMTTRGDIIVRNASNVTDRLGRGAAGTILTSDGTDVSWVAPLAYGSVKDTAGDHTITASATFADIDTTNCGFSITTGARKLMVGWSGSVFPDGTRRIRLDIAVDGTRVANTAEGAYISPVAAEFANGSFILITGSALSAGSHTVRLQGRLSVAAGTGIIAGGSANSPVGFLWARELSS